MAETLYMKIERNIVVHKPEVLLKDIASLTCCNSAILNKLKGKKIYHFRTSSGKKQKDQIAVFSILKVIQFILEEYPSLEIENIGAEDFILEYIPVQEAKWLGVAKAIFVCILVFFGSAFTIMTFNNEAGINDIFQQLYYQVTGMKSDGFTSLEVSYSLGLALGIIIFFNHLGNKKVTHDPTPLQVQMRKYQEEVDDTFIENCSRKDSEIDVD